jgi:hypothetical protein
MSSFLPFIAIAKFSPVAGAAVLSPGKLLSIYQKAFS